jgi:hypothetical protein
MKGGAYISNGQSNEGERNARASLARRILRTTWLQHVRYWHFSDMARCPCYDRFVQQSGHYEIADISDAPDDLSIVSDALALLRGDQFPKQWLLRPISIAAARWPFVVDELPKTAETASHLVGAFSRSPAHPASIKANSSAAKIFIRPAYP